MPTAIIGTSVTGTSSSNWSTTRTYASNSDGIKSALAEGHRHLVFVEPSVPIYETIDLDAYTGTFLKFEGGAFDQVRLEKSFSGGPLFKSMKIWQLYWSGLTFHGKKSVYQDGKPLVEFWSLDLCRFVECAWIHGSGDGFSGGFGPGPKDQFATSVFDCCRFADNVRNGMLARNAIDLSFVNKCVAQNNGMGYAGILYEGPISTHDSYKTRGLGSIMDCHFSNVADSVGIWLARVRGVDVLRNYMEHSRIRLEPDTSLCLVSRNRLKSTSTDNFGSNNTVVDPVVLT